MKVAFLNQPWASALPPSESVAIWTNEVARRLAAEHDVVVWSRERERPPAREDGVEHRFVSGRGDYKLLKALEPLGRVRPPRRPLFASRLYYASYYLGVARELRRAGFDVVHVHNFSQVVPLVRRALPGATVVLHMHCEWLSQLDPRLMARRVRAADLVLCCSEYVAERARRALPELAARIGSVANGVDVERFDAEAHPRADAPTRLLAVGRLSPDKGTHVLLDAWERLLERGLDVELELAGEPALVPPEMLVAIDESPRVRALASFYDGDYFGGLLARLSPRARERLTVSGFVPHREIPARYAAADVHVLPSVWEEPFGMPVAEAMAAGLPVVASRVGGVPEIVVEGETGLLVEPGDADGLADALARLVQSPELRRSLGEAGRRRARERFAWEVVAEELGRRYEEAARATAVPSRA